MKPKRVFLLYTLIVISFLLLTIAILKNTALSIGGKVNDTSFQVRTEFPNVNCTKTLKRQFPFFEFHCDKKELDNSFADLDEKVDTQTKENVGAISDP